MKKILTITLSLSMAAVLAVGIVGCNKSKKVNASSTCTSVQCEPADCATACATACSKAASCGSEAKPAAAGESCASKASCASKTSCSSKAKPAAAGESCASKSSCASKTSCSSEAKPAAAGNSGKKSCCPFSN